VRIDQPQEAVVLSRAERMHEHFSDCVIAKEDYKYMQWRVVLMAQLFNLELVSSL
jgi:hypothetical protein